MQYIIKEITEKPQYQSVWREQFTHVLQSWDWLSIKKNEGWSVLRLGLFPADTAENNVIPASIISFQIKTLPVLNSKFAYVPKLKSTLWIEPENQKQLADYLKKRHIDFVIYEFDKDVVLPDNNLTNYSGHIQPQQTNQVILGKSEEDLFMGLDGKYRRNIKKSQREGVTVTQYQFSSGSDNTKPITEFYKIMQSIYANTKFIERNAEYFQVIWNSLGADDLARIFLAELNKEDGSKEIVGAYLVVNDVVGAYELYGGVSIAGRSVEAGYCLKWEAIKYFNNLGLKYYDHWGVAPMLEDGKYDSSNELYQISRFKAGFGGEYVQFPTAKVQVLNNTSYSLFKLGSKAKALQTKLTKLFKSL